MVKVGIVNCGVSNVLSVYNAFLKLNIKVHIVENSKDFNNVTHIVLPGVGSFSAAMRNLRSKDFDNLIIDQIYLGKPTLGICLGMQLLAEYGEEVESTQGLNIFPGKIVKISTLSFNQKLPHMGWNQVNIVKNSRLASDIKEGVYYFAHSYMYQCDSDQYIKAYCQYGMEIPAIIERDNVIGLQFHPEKSQSAGLALLNKFVCLKNA